MAYNETPNFTLHNTAKAYDDAAAAILDIEVPFPLEVTELGCIITTATVVSTSPVIAVEKASASDRTTFTTDGATVTIPTGKAVGSHLVNRISSPVRYNPGDIIRMRIKTQGVGSAGQYKPYVKWKFAPNVDQSNTTVVTA